MGCVLREIVRFVSSILRTAHTLIVNDRLSGSGVQLHEGDEKFILFLNLTRDKRCWKIVHDFIPKIFKIKTRLRLF